MSTVAAGGVLTPTETITAKPSFLGVVRGEFLKVSRQWTTWIMLVLLGGIMTLPYLLSLARPHAKDLFAADPLAAMYQSMGSNLFVLRVFIGPVLIILTARLIGMEYSGGTIRVLLGRGVGRLQLLFGKLLTIGIIGLAILAAGLVWDGLLSIITLQISTGNLDALKALNSGFWQDTWLYIVTIMISMAVTTLMAAAITVLTRSLAAGLSVALCWFPADNIGVVFFYLAFKLTGSNFWTVITGDFLGPNLNAMAGLLLPSRASAADFSKAFTTPLVPVTGGHTLLITAIYAVIFLAVAVILTARRDVTQ
jgi:ABC-type transport system involved in multi-copper enzyme maturation permease subunit